MMTEHVHAQGAGESVISAKEFQSLVEMIGADMPDVVVDLLDTYLEESAGYVVTMAEAVQQHDMAAIQRPAHSLKSSSATVGALRLSKLAADLEGFLRGMGPTVDVPTQVAAIAQEFALVRAALEEEKARLG